jgi:hypothetical protein
MSFSLNDAEDNKVSKPRDPNTSYNAPGIYDNVVITDIKVDTPDGRNHYIVPLTKSPEGLGRSRKMYLNTDVKEGKTTSAWKITARQIVEIIKAANNWDDTQAKNSLGNLNLAADGVNINAEELAAKLSAVIVGKPFRAVFHGEQRTNAEGVTRVYTEMMYVESMNVPKAESKLKFDPTIHIKNVNVNTTATTATTAGANDLPF